MNATSEIELTDRQRQVLRDVFARYADRLDWVGVYGSRVQARARPGSDVDLAIFGPISPREVAAINVDLEESELSIFADAIAFDAITHPPLKVEVAKWVKPLFDRDDLAA